MKVDDAEVSQPDPIDWSIKSSKHEEWNQQQQLFRKFSNDITGFLFLLLTYRPAFWRCASPSTMAHGHVKTKPVNMTISMILFNVFFFWIGIIFWIVRNLILCWFQSTSTNRLRTKLMLGFVCLFERQLRSIRVCSNVSVTLE